MINKKRPDKECDICRWNLPIGLFCKNKSRSDGHNPTCKRCASIEGSIKALKKIGNYAEVIERHLMQIQRLTGLNNGLSIREVAKNEIK